ncbi:uncharacterized protein LOC125371188 [Ricinus communis]|uniref:uncharacterized protein LOC125371188 n=1 Tax=Ricinus communis TaxID=3988 RepID=UPI00201ACB7A|nr:uncharacterized protein LOC125371188 [Ricinus communis]
MAMQIAELIKQVRILASTKNIQSNEVNLMESSQPRQPRNNPYSNTYNPGTSKEDGLVDMEITEGGVQKEERIEPNLGQKKQDNEAFSGPKFHKATERYKPHIPFPNILKENKQDKQFSEILDMLSKVYINLPLLDVIRNMSAYAKLFKKLNSNKRRYGNDEKIMVSETASAVLQQQLPPKMKDLGSFTIAITIGDKKVVEAILN